MERNKLMNLDIYTWVYGENIRLTKKQDPP